MVQHLPCPECNLYHDLAQILDSLTEVGMQMLMAAPPLRHFYLEQPPRKLATFNSGLQDVFQGTSGLQHSSLHSRAKALAPCLGARLHLLQVFQGTQAC